MRPTRRIIIAIGSTLAVAALNAPTASAAPPTREVIPVQSDSIYTNLCAFPLRVQDQGTFIVRAFTDATGFVVRTTHVSGMFTDLGIGLGHALRGLESNSGRLILSVTVITGFLAGGLVGALSFAAVLYRALYLPAGLAFCVAIGYAVLKMVRRARP